jgi:hypothetical protein
MRIGFTREFDSGNDAVFSDGKAFHGCLLLITWESNWAEKRRMKFTPEYFAHDSFPVNDTPAVRGYFPALRFGEKFRLLSNIKIF